MRFPDTALRQIFSYLEFSDIASCRLVSKQWHRLDLDNFSFVLSFQHRATANYLSDWLVRMQLVPYPAWLDWNAAEIKARNKSEPPVAIRFDQMAAVIKSSFEQKIKHVVIKNMETSILSILPALATMAPAAVTICAVNRGKTTRFVRERQTDGFKCLELDIDSLFIGKVVVGYRLISVNASFIVKLTASNWSSVQMAIDRIGKSSDNELVFDKCEQLLVAESLDSSVGLFRRIAKHFPALQKLDFTTGGFSSDAAIEPLEQLANLRSLTVRNPSLPQKLLSKLRLPNLAELRLGSNILLPEDQANLFLPALTTLEMEACFKNAWRLSEYGVPVLCNLTALTTTKLQTEYVKPFLRSILPVSPKMQLLTIDLKLLNQLGRPVLTDIYDTLLVVPVCKAALTIGTFNIFPEAVDCRDLVRQRVADIKQRNLRTAITVAFKDNANNALVNTLSTAGTGGQGVLISAMADDAEADNCKSFELTWHNNIAGIQQKLKIRVSM